MRQKNYHDTGVAERFRTIAEENKARRKAAGEWSPDEPKETILDEERAKLTDENGKVIGYDKEEGTLLSQQYIADIFGLDWSMFSRLRFYRDGEIIERDGGVYFSARYVQSVIDEVQLIAESSLVTRLRPQPKTNEDGITVFNNEQVMAILDVSKNILQKYRDNRLIPFSLIGGKYFYTVDDIKTFLENIKYKSTKTFNK